MYRYFWLGLDEWVGPFYESEKGTLSSYANLFDKLPVYSLNKLDELGRVLASIFSLAVSEDVTVCDVYILRCNGAGARYSTMRG
ncbi:MAG: hypothetical protein QXD46_05015 [Thermofilum sp.]